MMANRKALLRLCECVANSLTRAVLNTAGDVGGARLYCNHSLGSVNLVRSSGTEQCSSSFNFPA